MTDRPATGPTLSQRTFEVAPPAVLLFGVGTIAQLGDRVGALGRRAVLVTDPGVTAAGVAATVRAALEAAGIATVVFDGVHANPTLDDVAQGAAIVGRGEVTGTVIVGLGGGSAMDAAKGVALLATNPGDVRTLDYRNVLAHPALPLVAIPTTAGTGAETNAFGVITDHEHGNKLYVGNATVMPALALLDPALTMGVPRVATANTGMDALTHAVEAMSSRNRNEYADGLSLQVATMVRTWLPLAVADGTDLEARSQLLLAAHLAGVAMSTGTGQGAAHGIGHALSTRLGMAHGAGLAVVLPHVMRFNLPLRTAAYARLALALGVGRVAADDDANALAAIAAVDSLSAEVGTARRLADFGLVDDAQVDQIAGDCLADSVTDNAPRYPTLDDARALVAAGR